MAPLSPLFFVLRVYNITSKVSVQKGRRLMYVSGLTLLDIVSINRKVNVGGGREKFFC